MVENWNLSIMYDHYYDQCQPVLCSYAYIAKNDAIYIVTTVFGLVGGLVTALKIAIPRLVRIITRIVRQYQTRIAPHAPVGQS